MGKNRVKRFGNPRPNPVGLITEKELQSELNENVNIECFQCDDEVPSIIANIFEKLQAPDSGERVCGCQELASAVSQPKALNVLLQQNAVKIVAPLFLDACISVRKSALEALRNMSAISYADICDVMVKSDILTPLTALIKQYDTVWLPEKSATKYDTSTDVLIVAMQLLSNLCENSNTAVRWFNKENLLKVLLPLLNVSTYGYGLSLYVARCLHVASDNNADVSQFCQQPDILSELLNIISVTPSGVDGVLFRTHVTGILLNLTGVDLTLYYKGIVTTITEVLDMDSFSVITAAFESVQDAAEEFKPESYVSWQEVDSLMDAQGISLELLANMCCSDDDWEDVEGLGSSDSSDDQAMEATCEAGADMMEDASNRLCLASEISRAFVEKDVFSKILKKAYPIDSAQISKLEATQRGRTILRKLRDLQSRALLSLSNIVGVIDASYLTQFVPLTSIWTELYKLASYSQEFSDNNFVWAVTSAMRAVIQQLAETQSSNLGDITSSDLEFLMSLTKDNKNRETQINIVRIISTVGCILSLNQQPHPLLKEIGSILVDVACHTEDLVVAAEALDSLFDVFKEDHTDSVAQEIGLVNKLIKFNPSFKCEVARQRKSLGENYVVVMMVKSNLARYIKYKQSHK